MGIPGCRRSVPVRALAGVVLCGALTACAPLAAGADGAPTRVEQQPVATQDTATPPLPPAPPAAPTPVVAARKPVATWGQPTRPAALARDIQVVNLITVATTPLSGSADSVITSVLVFSAPIGKPATRVDPDVAQLRASDSLGHRHPATYRELVRADGATIGAVSVRATAGPRRTISLDVGAVRTGPGSATTVAGPWTVDLVRQLADAPLPGRVEIGFGYRTPPLRTPAGDLRALYAGGGLVTITIDRPTGPETLHVAGMEDGHARAVSGEEMDRLRPRPPKPFVFGTPRPESPLR